MPGFVVNVTFFADLEVVVTFTGGGIEPCKGKRRAVFSFYFVDFSFFCICFGSGFLFIFWF